jgi:hypothetical protein
MRSTFLVLFLVAPPVFALQNFDRNGGLTSGSAKDREVEIRHKDANGNGSKIRGDVDSFGDFRGRDRDGNRYKGSIDEDGYGKIRDGSGNSFKVRPRD